MKCYTHPSLNAVSQCQSCSRGLCRKCTDKYTTPVCNKCVEKAKGDQAIDIKKEWLYIIGLPILIASIMHNLMKQSGDSVPWIILYFIFVYVVGAYLTGRKVLSRISTNRIYIMSLPIWLVRSYLKFAVALFIGCYLFPFRALKQLFVFVKNTFFK